MRTATRPPPSLPRLRPATGRDVVPDADGVRLALSGALLVVVVTAGTALAWGVPATCGLVAVAVGACGSTLTRTHAVLLAVTGWALLTGFAVNAQGQLTFADGDLLRLGLLVVLALLVGPVAAHQE